jgi:glycosyltransferase involved in cell wall biosynthesis
VVVGSGDERRFGALARERGVGSHVRFVGPRTDAERFYRACDVFVLPSEYEALPLVVLEALAAAIPVVATPVNGVHELFDGQHPGYLVERTGASVANALAGLAADPQLRAEMGFAGRAVVRDLTWEKSVEGTLRVLRSVLRAKGGELGDQSELIGSTM